MKVVPVWYSTKLPGTAYPCTNCGFKVESAYCIGNTAVFICESCLMGQVLDYEE